MTSWYQLNLKDLAFGCSNVSDLTEVLPFFFWLRSGDRQDPYIVMGLYFLCSGGISIYGYLTANAGIHNMFLYHIWALLQLIFLYLFYSSLWAHKPKVAWIAVVFVLFVSSSIWFQKLENINALGWTTTTLAIIFFGTFHFYRLYNDDSITTSVTKRPDFLITTGWMIYSAGALFAYLMGQDILTGEADGFFKNAWVFQSVSNIAKTGICCYGFSLLKK